MPCGKPAEATPCAGCQCGRGTGRATLRGQGGSSVQSRAHGCSLDYEKMRVHHTRPTASRTFEGEGSGQPGDAFWKELIDRVTMALSKY